MSEDTVTTEQAPETTGGDPTRAESTEGAPGRQRNVFYGDLVVPIPEGASREDIREVMLRAYPELANATMMDLPEGDVRFVMAAGEKG